MNDKSLSEITKIHKTLRLDPNLFIERDVGLNVGNLSLVKDFRTNQRLELPKPSKYLIKIRDISDILEIRRSIRRYDPFEELTLEELSTLLYYSCGVTELVDGIYGKKKYPLRACPSSGGLCGVDIYIIARHIRDANPGIYYYDFIKHELVALCNDCIPSITINRAVFNQRFVGDAAVLIVFVANIQRGLWKYGIAYYKYVLVDVGIIAENVHLVSTSMGLASCMVAGFDEETVSSILQLDIGEFPVLMLTIGRPHPFLGKGKRVI